MIINCTTLQKSSISVNLLEIDRNLRHFHPVHMFTEEIPADTESIADFQHTTADDMTTCLLMQAITQWSSATFPRGLL